VLDDFSISPEGGGPQGRRRGVSEFLHGYAHPENF
jgi:hypothetical protein